MAGQNQWYHFGVGEFTTHDRTYFSGWIGMFTGENRAVDPCGLASPLRAPSDVGPIEAKTERKVPRQEPERQVPQLLGVLGTGPARAGEFRIGPIALGQSHPKHQPEWLGRVHTTKKKVGLEKPVAPSSRFL